MFEASFYRSFELECVEPFDEFGGVDGRVPFPVLHRVDGRVPQLMGLNVPLLAVRLDPCRRGDPPVPALVVGRQRSEQVDEMGGLVNDGGDAESVAAVLDLFGEVVAVGE